MKKPATQISLVAANPTSAMPMTRELSSSSTPRRLAGSEASTSDPVSDPRPLTAISRPSSTGPPSSTPRTKPGSMIWYGIASNEPTRPARRSSASVRSART